MLDETMSALINVRLIQAREDLQGAEVALEANLLKGSANRSYYCIFHAMRAVLALERFDSHKHSGIIAAFRQKYIKSGIFPIDFSEIIKVAFRIRNDSDYQDFYIISKSDAENQIASAKTFLAAVEEYIYAKYREADT
jgi:uncharacterized protein (UPF0332 family)